MTPRAIDYSEPQLLAAPEPQRTVLLKLYARAFDILLLRRQLAAVLACENAGTQPAALAAMIARSIAERLADACELFRKPQSPIFAAFVVARSDRGAAEFRRYFDGPDAVVHRLRTERGGRDVAEVVGETLFATDLFFLVAQEIFTAALTPAETLAPAASATARPAAA